MSDQDVWQPIATIPKDGSIVRGLLDDGSEADVTYSKNGRRTTVLVRGTGGQFWRPVVGPQPTHWHRECRRRP